MKEYSIIGSSIIMIVILVLASLSNVVGYKSVQTTITNDSPLFTVRAQRAINQAGKVIPRSNYLSKGIDSTIQFPARDNRTELLKTIFEIIKKMDNTTFQRFLFLLQQHLKVRITLNKQQLLELNNVITEIRKQNTLPIPPVSQMYSLGCPPSIFDKDNVYCILYAILAFIGYIPLAIVVLIYGIIHSLLPEILLFIT